jgi:hypothetical protein
MEAWVGIVITSVLGGGTISAILVYAATRQRNRQTGIAERFDDASELSKYIDARVEAKVAPIRDELATVKKESHEIQDAFREWVSGVWLWNKRGRVGDIPMPPTKILSRLGLGHFVDEWPTEPPA